MTGSTSGNACGARGGVATAGAGQAPLPLPPPDAAVRAEGLEKRYGDKRALDGLDLTVHRGTVHGLLGPNGAGKTTVVRILATLLRPDGGRAAVAGHEVTRAPQRVRARIGLAGQYAAVDGILTGRQNLEMFGRLFHLGARRARVRATELLDQFGLGDAGGKSARTYSGGMRRRLDLAASLILAPEVLFLDEPTTGLDPRGRNEVWESVRRLAATGTTVLLTTQYLDEADQLADRVSVIEHGRTIADGTPAELKRQVGGERLQVVLRDPADLPYAVRTVARVAANGVPPTTDEAERRVGAPVTEGVAALTEVARTLQDEGIGVEDIGLRRPTLDEVFLRLTGRGTAGTGQEAAA
ncbi:ATP-binding cassette domain-containing protein [Streptomyces sp. NPDC048637]|uniref:ATP-binding cassette domain-containing protein n=1 Tax=Streptomyces sp. NPDC048637 TaxID=3155636 RepID=UPI00342ECACA